MIADLATEIPFFIFILGTYGSETEETSGDDPIIEKKADFNQQYMFFCTPHLLAIFSPRTKVIDVQRGAWGNISPWWIRKIEHSLWRWQIFPLPIKNNYFPLFLFPLPAPEPVLTYGQNLIKISLCF